MHEQRKDKEVSKQVKEIFGLFFELGAEAQDIAYPLFVEATIMRGRAFAEKDSKSGYSTALNAQNMENRWKDYVDLLANKLAETMDPGFWAGHGANLDEVNKAKNNFIKMLYGRRGQDLLAAKELIEKVIGK